MYKTDPGYMLLKKKLLTCNSRRVNYKTIEKIGLQIRKKEKKGGWTIIVFGKGYQREVNSSYTKVYNV